MRNKKLLGILIVAGVFFFKASVFADTGTNESNTVTMPVEIHFAPFEDIVPMIIREIKSATTSIHASLYGIDNKDIANALVERAKAGLKIQIGEDKLQAAGKSDLHSFLMQNGISIVIKPASELEHNKWMIIDSNEVLEGSFNYSSNAQKQDNSFLILHSPQATSIFEEDFQKVIARDSSSVTINNKTRDTKTKPVSAETTKPPTANVTAQCKDGTYYLNSSHKGACSKHGGVKKWL